VLRRARLAKRTHVDAHAHEAIPPIAAQMPNVTPNHAIQQRTAPAQTGTRGPTYGPSARGAVGDEAGGAEHHAVRFGGDVGGALPHVRQPKVAKATDGAEPNTPARVAGLQSVPTSANAVTITPPSANLSAVSVITSLLRDALHRR